MVSIITRDGLKLMLNRTFKSNPDYSEPSLFKVGTGTTEPTTVDTDLETPVTIDTGETKAFLSGYPTIDETNLQIKIRAFLNSLEANGNNLTEFGIFNNDTNKKMWSRATHNSITKNDSVEITYVEVDKL